MDYRAMAAEAARRYGIPEQLFLAQINQESRFNPQARSHAGAMGLGQLMPGTARDLGVQNPWDPYQNLDGSARYMAQQLQAHGNDPRLALAAYNAGPGNVAKHGGIPPFRETQNYVNTIMASFGGAPAAPQAPAQQTAQAQPGGSLGGLLSGGLLAAAGGMMSSMGGGAAPQLTEAEQIGDDTMAAIGRPELGAGALPAPSTMGAPGMTPPMPQGRQPIDHASLLDFLMQMQPQPEPAPEPDWLERKTGGWMTQDRRDKLALGLEGMTLNPNQALMKSLQGDIEGRATTAKENKVEAKAKEAQNRTAAWLAGNGREDLAALLMSGSLTGGDAVKLALAPPETTAMQDNLKTLMDYGLSFDEALTHLGNIGGSSRNTSIGTIPPGYQLVEAKGPNGEPITRMEPIPGSPAEIEVQTLDDKQGERNAGQGRVADRALDDIAEIRRMTTDGGMPTTGFIGNLMSHVGGDALDVGEMIASLESNMAFDRLQQMRDNSTSGGALGSVSNIELDLLKKSIASLRQRQSQPQFLRALEIVEQEYRRILDKAAAYPNAAEYGFTATGPLPTASPNTNDPGRNPPVSWRVVE